jgi:peptide/nickel transport system ATP-binding protein
MGNPLLQVEQLVVVSSDKTQRRLVDNVSFDLKAGEVLGLIGESGAGKSTIGLAILGHCRHVSDLMALNWPDSRSGS